MVSKYLHYQTKTHEERIVGGNSSMTNDDRSWLNTALLSTMYSFIYLEV